MEITKFLLCLAGIPSCMASSQVKENKNVSVRYNVFVVLRNAVLNSPNNILVNLTVKNQIKCEMSCLKHDHCESYNVGPVNGEFECQLLNTNKYVNGCSVVDKPLWLHASVKHNECEAGICRNKQTCLPDYINHTSSCLCDKIYIGQFCQYKVPVIVEAAIKYDPLTPDFWMPADRALDGNTNQAYSSNSCAYARISTPGIIWWKVRFGESMFIHHVEIFARDIEPWFAQQSTVTIGEHAQPWSNVECSPLQGTNYVEAACLDDRLRGRYVAIYQRYNVVPDIPPSMTICEVNVVAM